MTISTNYNVAQRNTFKGDEDEPPKKHYGAAMASYALPGTGQLINGEKQRGFVHLGIWTGLAAGLYGAFTKDWISAIDKVKKSGDLADTFKTFIKDMPKSKKVLGAALIVGIYANSISSAISAYKGK